MMRLRRLLFGKPNAIADSHPISVTNQKEVTSLDQSNPVKTASNIYTVLGEKFNKADEARLIAKDEIVWMPLNRKKNCKSEIVNGLPCKEASASRKAKIKTNPWMCVTPLNLTPSTPSQSSVPASLLPSNDVSPAVVPKQIKYEQSDRAVIIKEVNSTNYYQQQQQRQRHRDVACQQTDTINRRYSYDCPTRVSVDARFIDATRKPVRDTTNREIRKENGPFKLPESVTSRKASDEAEKSTAACCQLKLFKNSSSVEAPKSDETTVTSLPADKTYSCRVVQSANPKFRLVTPSSDRPPGITAEDEVTKERREASDLSSDGYSSLGSIYSEESLNKLSSEPTLYSDIRNNNDDVINDANKYRESSYVRKVHSNRSSSGQQLDKNHVQNLDDSGCNVFEEAADGAGWKLLMRTMSSIRRELTWQKYVNEKSLRLLGRCRRLRQTGRQDNNDLLTHSDITFDRGHLWCDDVDGRMDGRSNSLRGRPRDDQPERDESNCNYKYISSYGAIRLNIAEPSKLDRDADSVYVNHGEGHHGYKMKRNRISVIKNKAYTDASSLSSENSEEDKLNSVYTDVIADCARLPSDVISFNLDSSSRGDAISKKKAEFPPFEYVNITSNISKNKEIILNNNLKRNYFFSNNKQLESEKERKYKESVNKKKEFLIQVLKSLTKNLAEQKIMLQTTYDELLKKQFPNLF